MNPIITPLAVNPIIEPLVVKMAVKKFYFSAEALASLVRQDKLGAAIKCVLKGDEGYKELAENYLKRVLTDAHAGDVALAKQHFGVREEAKEELILADKGFLPQIRVRLLCFKEKMVMWFRQKAPVWMFKPRFSTLARLEKVSQTVEVPKAATQALVAFLESMQEVTTRPEHLTQLGTLVAALPAGSAERQQALMKAIRESRIDVLEKPELFQRLLDLGLNEGTTNPRWLARAKEQSEKSENTALQPIWGKIYSELEQQDAQHLIKQVVATKTDYHRILDLIKLDLNPPAFATLVVDPKFDRPESLLQFVARQRAGEKWALMKAPCTDSQLYEALQAQAFRALEPALQKYGRIITPGLRNEKDIENAVQLVQSLDSHSVKTFSLGPQSLGPQKQKVTLTLLDLAAACGAPDLVVPILNHRAGVKFSQQELNKALQLAMSYRPNPDTVFALLDKGANGGKFTLFEKGLVPQSEKITLLQAVQNRINAITDPAQADLKAQWQHIAQMIQAPK